MGKWRMAIGAAVVIILLLGVLLTVVYGFSLGELAVLLRKLVVKPRG